MVNTYVTYVVNTYVCMHGFVRTCVYMGSCACVGMYPTYIHNEKCLGEKHYTEIDTKEEEQHGRGWAMAEAGGV